ncbi:DGQHR domain-containing protein DpdB [Thalassobaculum sp.]|uniref:DGQHR domain-containing protein DpdB n=1 Tax=Thalassobaculum sp. TaxID=2022740 RepID=UPI003B5C56A8
MSLKRTFTAIRAQQSEDHQVFTFAASAEQVFEIARIDRVGRTEQGDLFGFQRPQVASHILEIRDYLQKPNAVLPNSVVLAFVDDVTARLNDDGTATLEIDLTNGAPGLVVDGQQRLTALQPLKDRDFQVFVSAIICPSDEDLRRQFILINNTRPLPKELIYELLPTVSGLPHRMSARAFAAQLTSKLNYWTDDRSGPPALKGEIRQHTNPSGTISSNAIQRVIMNSRSNGALRDLAGREDSEEASLQLIADFYGAVMDTFPEAWIGMTPRTSRLKHSAGIIALGYAMETAYAVHGARDRTGFADKIACLAEGDICCWTSGYWILSPNESRMWDRIQNTQPDIRLLSDFLVRIVRDQGIRAGSGLAEARANHREFPQVARA